MAKARSSPKKFNASSSKSKKKTDQPSLEAYKAVCRKLRVAENNLCRLEGKAPEQHAYRLVDVHERAKLEDNHDTLVKIASILQRVFILGETAHDDAPAADDKAEEDEIPSEECPICADEFTKASDFVVFPCGHAMCQTCFPEYNQSLIDNHTIREDQISCPQCRKTHAMGDLQRKPMSLDEAFSELKTQVNLWAQRNRQESKPWAVEDHSFIGYNGDSSEYVNTDESMDEAEKLGEVSDEEDSSSASSASEVPVAVGHLGEGFSDSSSDFADFPKLDPELEAKIGEIEEEFTQKQRSQRRRQVQVMDEDDVQEVQASPKKGKAKVVIDEEEDQSMEIQQPLRKSTRGKKPVFTQPEPEEEDDEEPEPSANRKVLKRNTTSPVKRNKDKAVLEALRAKRSQKKMY